MAEAWTASEEGAAHLGQAGAAGGLNPEQFRGGRRAMPISLHQFRDKVQAGDAERPRSTAPAPACT
jgi:hypothetical protein